MPSSRKVSLSGTWLHHVIDDTTTQGCEEKGRRGDDNEVSDGPLIARKPNNDKPVVHPGGGIDVTQDRSELQQRDKMLREGERHSPHTTHPKEGGAWVHNIES